MSVFDDIKLTAIKQKEKQEQTYMQNRNRRLEDLREYSHEVSFLMDRRKSRYKQYAKEKQQ